MNRFIEISDGTRSTKMKLGDLVEIAQIMKRLNAITQSNKLANIHADKNVVVFHGIDGECVICLGKGVDKIITEALNENN